MQTIPIFNTKTEGVTRVFDLTDPAERKEYFMAKAGPEIEKIKKYLADGNTFAVHDNTQGFGDVFIVIKRLAHAHHDDV